MVQGPSESAIPLLQLPYFDQDLLKRLGRKQVRALPDLFLMQPEDRRDVYAFAGQPCCSLSLSSLFVFVVLWLLLVLSALAVRCCLPICMVALAHTSAWLKMYPITQEIVHLHKFAISTRARAPVTWGTSVEAIWAEDRPLQLVL